MVIIIFTLRYIITLSLLVCIIRRILFDPLYDELVTNNSELMVYFARHIFMELVLPLSIFCAIMITLLVDWSFIPLSSTESERGISLEDLKKSLFE